MRIALRVLIVLLALAAYLLFWPVPVEPVAWTAPPDPGYAGPHALNHGLAGLQQIPLDGHAGPEHIAVGPGGKLYAAVEGGKVMRMNLDGNAREVFADTGGRVLGFDFDANGRMIAADALRGLLSIAPDGTVKVLADRVSEGDPIRFADAVVVAVSGRIYLTDASTRFAPAAWGGTFEASVLDILEQSSTGRVLEYHPASGRTRIVARGFSFANGLALSRDQQSLFVAETGKYRLWRVDIAADNLDVRPGASAQARIVFDNLPGYPDNVVSGLDGRYWVGFTKPRSPAVDAMAGQPLLRKMTLRLPRALWPVPPNYGHVFAFTEDGRVVADLQDPGGSYPQTTAVTETTERLYVQSLNARGIGWKPR